MDKPLQFIEALTAKPRRGGYLIDKSLSIDQDSFESVLWMTHSNVERRLWLSHSVGSVWLLQLSHSVGSVLWISHSNEGRN